MLHALLHSFKTRFESIMEMIRQHAIIYSVLVTPILHNQQLDFPPRAILLLFNHQGVLYGYPIHHIIYSKLMQINTTSLRKENSSKYICKLYLLQILHPQQLEFPPRAIMLPWIPQRLLCIEHPNNTHLILNDKITLAKEHSLANLLTIHMWWTN